MSPCRFAVLLLVLALTARAGFATSTLPGFEDGVFAPGIINGTAMGFAPDGRLFVCQQGGALRVVKQGAVLPTPFLSIPVDSNGERGLLGVAFDPDFANNGYVYVYHTVPGSPAHNRISRFTAAGDVAVPGSEFVVLDLDNLSSATNHNGGSIHFGSDGKLYVGVGENANGANSQTLSNRLGKMLRINPDGTIPADNPFYNTATGANRSIWAMGLRNPFTFGVHPRTGRIFIDDVGQNTWEEINDGIAGSNYGWPNAEGISTNPAYRNPLYVYNHSTGNPTGCAIAGGAFYDPDFRQYPSTYTGKYLYADLCGAWIWLFDPSAGTASQFASQMFGSTVDLKIGPDGSLYYLEHDSNGFVGRIRYTSGIYKLPDAAEALRLAAGLKAPDAVLVSRLNVVNEGPSSGIVDILDAVRIAQVVAQFG